MNKKEMRSLLSEAVEKWNPKKDKSLKDDFYGGFKGGSFPADRRTLQERVNEEREKIKLQGVIKFYG